MAKKIFELQVTGVDKAKKDIASVATSTAQLEKELNDVEQSTAFTDLAREANTANEATAGSINELRALKKALRELEIGSEAFVNAAAKVKRLEEDLQDARERAGTLAASVGAFDAGSIDDLNAQLKQLQGELDGARVGSEKYIAAQSKIEGVRRQIQVASQSLREQREALLQFGATALGTFSQATALVQSFGAENQDAIKAIKALEQAQAIAGAAQGAVELQKQAAIARTTAATLANTQATGAAAVATRALGTAFQIALGPIGLTIAAVGALAGAYLILSRNANAAATAQNQITAAQERVDQLFEQRQVNEQRALEARKRLEIAQRNLSKEEETSALKALDRDSKRREATRLLAQAQRENNIALEARRILEAQIAEGLNLEEGEKKITAQIQAETAAYDKLIKSRELLTELEKEDAAEREENQRKQQDALRANIESQQKANELKIVELQIRGESVALSQQEQLQILELQKANAVLGVELQNVGTDYRDYTTEIKLATAAIDEQIRKLKEVPKVGFDLTKIEDNVDGYAKSFEEANKVIDTSVNDTNQRIVDQAREAVNQERLTLKERLQAFDNYLEAKKALNVSGNEELDRQDRASLEQAIANTEQAKQNFKAAAAELVNFADTLFAAAEQRRTEAIEAQAEQIQERIANLDSQIQEREGRAEELEARLQDATAAQSETIKEALLAEQAQVQQLQNARAKAAADQARLEKEKVKIQRQAAIREKAINSVQVIQQTAAAIISALAQVPKFDFGVSAGVLAASYGAIGAAQLATIAATPIPQFSSGGFTGQGGKYDVAGIVHKGEYVVPKQIVEQPRYAATIMDLERARVRGFADGGFTSTPTMDMSGIEASLASLGDRIEALANVQPIVDVRAITDVQEQTRKVQTSASL